MTRRTAPVLLAAALFTACSGLAACSGSSTQQATPPPTIVTTTTTTRRVLAPRIVKALPVPAALFAAGLNVRAGPVPVPLQLEIPSIGVNSGVLGVGVTTSDVMDAPEGPIHDPVWEQAFWYRGSAVPGAISTALIAGHVDGPRGTPGVFGAIGLLKPGALIVVHDTRSGLDVRFVVTHTVSFTLDQTTQKSVLTEIYGAGPVAGTTPQRAKDGLSHLTLITCAGTFQTGIGTHDHRLAVFATRIK